MMVVDPVCGMELMPELAIAETDYDGQTYYFCSEDCFEAFDEDPERYVIAEAQEMV